jgi:hypothetical protein
VKSVSINVPHGMLFILDPNNADVLMPECVDGELVSVTDSCISVATLVPVDGDTEVSMAFNEAAPRELIRVAYDNISVPHGRLAITTSDDGGVFEADVPVGRVTVSIWVDDLEDPSRVFVNVESGIGSAHSIYVNVSREVH